MRSNHWLFPAVLRLSCASFVLVLTGCVAHLQAAGSDVSNSSSGASVTGPAVNKLEQRLVEPDGTYRVRQLEKEVVTLTLIQTSAPRPESSEDEARVYEKNLSRMLELGRQACAEDDPDIVLFHEFPITGYVFGDREAKLKKALEIPGPESKSLGALAKSCDSYVIYGSYARDPQWPGHILSLATVVGRDGQVVDTIWKARNIKRFYSSFEITTTTVEGVYDRFVELYGPEAVLPVLRTEFGNLAISTVQLAPLVFAAFAMQGAEIFLRTATLFFESDVISTSMIHNTYSAMANMTHDSKWGGHSMVVDPGGKVLGRIESATEEGILSVQIPIAAFREGRRIPQYSVELTASIFDQYVDEIPQNHMDLNPEVLPKDGKAMKQLLDERSRWLEHSDSE